MLIIPTRAELQEFDRIALEVTNRRKRQNTWDFVTLEITDDGAALLTAHTNAAVSTVAGWFEDADAMVLSIVTDGAQGAVAVTYKAAKHGH